MKRLHTFTARMPVEDYERLRAHAFRLRVSINAVVVRAVREHLGADSK